MKLNRISKTGFTDHLHVSGLKKSLLGETSEGQYYIALCIREMRKTMSWSSKLRRESLYFDGYCLMIKKESHRIFCCSIDVEADILAGPPNEMDLLCTSVQGHDREGQVGDIENIGEVLDKYGIPEMGVYSDIDREEFALDLILYNL